MTSLAIFFAGLIGAPAPSAAPAVPSLASPTGRIRLGLTTGRDGLVYVPRGHRAEVPAPLLVLFHGAGGDGAQMIEIMSAWADAHGVLLLAPDSRGSTWDAVRGELGPDLAFLDRALAEVQRRWAVDGARLAVGGFSDGASYALTVGLREGDRFGHVLAFSPGFIAHTQFRGRPRVFVSHGVRDRVLPIDACSRRIRRALVAAGYDVRYEEFDGPHRVPPEIAAAAGDWWLAGQSPRS
jgi:phospholipase/carboxylesterase